MVRLDDLRRCLEPYGFKTWELHKADKERFLTEDEIIMTQMYTYGKAVHDGKTELPQDISFPDLEIKSEVESTGVSPLSSPLGSPVPERKMVEPLPSPSPSPTQPTQQLPKLKLQKLPGKSQRGKNKKDDMIPMDSVSEIKAPWYKSNEKVVRIGAIGDGSCFFHSVLNAYLKLYQTNPDPKFRRKFVKDLRRDVSLTLSLPDPNNPNMTRYETAANGQFVALAEQQEQGLSFTDVFDQPVDFTLEGLQKLFDSDMYLGDEIYGYLADLLNLDIYVMRLEGGELKRHLDTRGDVPRKSVVISGNGYHFETVGVMRNGLYQTLFLPDDPFITGFQ